ncbi:DUF1360 domain-containing protein [Parafilimonas sp.]|uniref:DUF1360 domain-containing protein n=1 Tax=Parafilimonas sp. TaxID=1969739 RepID=UPI0039E3DDA5
MNILYLILSVFAVWRITHLLNKEEGPFDIIFLIRKKAGNSVFGKLMDCFYCLSIWIALPFGLWLGTNWIEKILAWLALSGAAAWLEQATTKNDSGNGPTHFED